MSTSTLSSALGYVTSSLANTRLLNLTGPAAASAAAGPSFEGRDLDRIFHAKIRPLLDAVDQLRGILTKEEDIQLPTIVVVGDQSSGKSSVLEALSGVSLPRGQNITTRCPLVLRLINSSSSDDKKKDSADSNSSSSSSSSSNSGSSGEPYAVISTKSMNVSEGEKIYNLSEVGRYIEDATAQLAGRGVGVVSTPIYLSVFRPNCPDLTLVDLPGITRNPIGDQPKDIYNMIKNMIYKFITPEASVILNVMPATVDFSTCEGVMMSKEVDPQGIRTIGVVTKLDLAEKGIARKLLTGTEQLNLKLGVVAVRNRTQEENERGVSFEVAREMEKQYFANHNELSEFNQQFDSSSNSIEEKMSLGATGGLYLGTSNLAAVLTVIQEQRIRSTLPKIRQKVREQLAEQRLKYKELPAGVTTVSECRVRIEHLLTTYIQQLQALVTGNHISVSKGDTKLHISPRLTELYHVYQKSLKEALSPFLSVQYSKVVEEEIKENSGVTLPNFLSAHVFNGLMHRELAKVKQPSFDLISSARNLLSDILQIIAKQVFIAHPTICQRICAIIQSYLDQKQSVISGRFEELYLQESEMFTLNPYYIDTVHKIKAAFNEKIGQIRAQGGSNRGGMPQSVQIHVNDLLVHVEGALLNSMMAPPSPSPADLATNPTIVLDMQVNCFAYSQICLRRLLDNLPGLIRLHLLSSISHTPVTLSPNTHISLYAILQKEFMEMTDKVLLENMREEREVAMKRERVGGAIARLEKALQIFDSL